MAKRKTSVLEPECAKEDLRTELSLRPKTFADYVGQTELIEKIKIYVKAAQERREALDHCLFSGPPGLGKTSLAHILAAEMRVGLHVSSGPALEKKGDLAGILTNLSPGDILFIDEIHRLGSVVEEYLYPAMEDYRLDITIDSGPAARAMKIDLAPFTLVAATTRVGLLTSPLRNRFHIQERLEFYTQKELMHILRRSAQMLSVQLDAEGAAEIARRSRGTPRIAIRLLRRVRDFAQIQSQSHIHLRLACEVLDRLQVDKQGLDLMDRRLLRVLVEKFSGGPVGIETLSAALGEEKETLEDVCEPFLLQQGLLQRTPRGRLATERTWEYIGYPAPKRENSD
ncbi:MAG: Holliday junction branch migration DNA helicase RuvB [Cystobacterineae bacterium]|nr:Holliday junction branch migration DNA helicase RuvB [Cystobacterineae bacterium]